MFGNVRINCPRSGQFPWRKSGAPANVSNCEQTHVAGSCACIKSFAYALSNTNRNTKGVVAKRRPSCFFFLEAIRRHSQFPNGIFSSPTAARQRLGSRKLACSDLFRGLGGKLQMRRLFAT